MKKYKNLISSRSVFPCPISALCWNWSSKASTALPDVCPTLGISASKSCACLCCTTSSQFLPSARHSDGPNSSGFLHIFDCNFLEYKVKILKFDIIRQLLSCSIEWYKEHFEAKKGDFHC